MNLIDTDSYPPHFGQVLNNRSAISSSVTNIEEDDDDDEIQDSDHPAVPLIDFQCLDLDKLGEVCKEWGLFRLVNHGIPFTLLTQLQHHAKILFSLPFQSKQRLCRSRSSSTSSINSPAVSYFWGTPALSPSGNALFTGPQHVNWVEGFNVPISRLSQLEAQDPLLDDFRILLEEYGRHLARLATTIFGAMAKNLNLNAEQSESHLSESTGLIRVYRYPRCSKESEAWGINAHTDSSVLSILNQDQVGGLQVLKDDKWLHVKPIPNTLIINLGDMMQAISDDEYKSVKHRVKVNKDEERFSICYFVFPAEGTVINSSKYKPFSYSDFQAQVQQDIKTMGFKVGLERFKFTTDHDQEAG